ncbi:MAG: hypothetical protein COB73_00010 [Flavobacteriaceae bacterium]|nr:MAG: hypothetical protein COB73_00010 [Flavobacteriaceae bacterium]
MTNKILFNFLLLFISIATLTSCTNTNDSCDATYFGGHIINPKQNFLFLSKADIIIDTIFLDSYNNFITEVNVDEEGLYSFSLQSSLGYEYQYIYFEPKDSILIRLNTWDFDESLAFSGRGAEKNNFLITLYLQNEKEGKNFSPYYNLKSDKFEEKITTSKSMNNFLYDQFKESGIEITPQFDELAQIAINFPLNSKKEYYPFIHKNRFQLNDFPLLSDTYFDFRKNLDLNQEKFIYFAPYYSYISGYINAISHTKNSSGSNKTVKKLNTILDKITVEPLRNMLLKQTIYGDFRKSKNTCTIDMEALKVFNDNCTNKDFLKYINNLATDCEEVTQNTSIDDFKVVSFDGVSQNINTIISNKKTVIYFWSPTIIRPEMLVKKVKYLENKYPELQFIGINMNPNELSNSVNKKLKNQYILTKTSNAHNYVKSLEPRTILINSDGLVTNSFTYLTSPHLERQLTILTKK